ncbi:MAG: ABC transporter substrate-binding protein [Anaerolineae bacterium]|nr:MAG: ABC transporter substrate-binding protein [Anaerolineae bacterium]
MGRTSAITCSHLPAGLWVLVIAGIILTGCTATRPTVKIGLVAPFEGAQRALGYEVLYAVKLALQERNDQGGVGGFGIELVALSDDGQPANAVRQVQALAVDPGVVGVLGPGRLPPPRRLHRYSPRPGCPWWRRQRCPTKRCVCRPAFIACTPVTMPWPRLWHRQFPVTRSGPSMAACPGGRPRWNGPYPAQKRAPRSLC